MTRALDYSTLVDARKHLTDAYDAAERGAVVRMGRSGSKTNFALLGEERLRAYFEGTTSPRLRLGMEEGAWIASMDERPFVAEGLTIEDALEALIADLRDYASEWEEHYSSAPNHQAAWGLVMLVRLSDDDQLRAWLRQ